MDTNLIKPIVDVAQWVFFGVTSWMLWLRRPGQEAKQALALLKAENEKSQIELMDVVRKLQADHDLLNARLQVHGSAIEALQKVQERRLERLETFFMNNFNNAE